MTEKLFLDESSPEFTGIRKEWEEKARSIKTFDEFAEFYDHLLEDYYHDYGTVCHAIGQLAVAAASLGAHIEGITGFQAGFVMWKFILNWMFPYNRTGLRLINYDDMLFPQYAYEFDKVISAETLNALKNEAANKLREHPDANQDVIAHWKSIVNGEVPFGYRIEED